VVAGLALAAGLLLATGWIWAGVFTLVQELEGLTLWLSVATGLALLPHAWTAWHCTMLVPETISREGLSVWCGVLLLGMSL
jgi:hypothetical protein